jgi:glycosyltransferase involved in cell wall biosynthesis
MKKNKSFILYLTYGSSLKKWHEFGILERELSLYYRLEKYYNITIISYGDKNEYKFINDKSKIKIISNITNTNLILYSLYLPIKYKNIFKKSSFYKTNQLWGAHVAIWVKLFINKPLILRQGFDFFKQTTKNQTNFIKILLYKIYEFISFRFCNLSIISTNKIKNDLIKRYKFIKNKIFVVPNYVIIKKYEIIKFKEKLSYNFIFAGRLENEKNLYNLIRAFKVLKNHNLSIIGNGSLEKDLKKIAKNIKNISFYDRQDQKILLNYINKSDFFILPSLIEGHPKILLEAMSTGTIVISSCYDGINEVIQNKKNGFICGFTSNSIISTINQIINSDKKIFDKISKEAKDFVRKNYDLSKIVNKEKMIYNKI